MAVLVQYFENGLPASHNFASAIYGFREMGAEIIPFSTYEELKPRLAPENIVVGFVGTVRYALNEMGFSVPEMDYPEELSGYLGRRVWKSTVNTINSSPEQWPVFIKPLEDKAFTGVLVQSPKDLIGCGNWARDQEVYCCEPVKFISEWRCFVRYGQILDVRHYKGYWGHNLDAKVIEQAIKDFKSAPAGYSADFGLTEDGRMLLIEINDGYALGSYGLVDIDYAKLLSARWSELAGVKDEFDFRR